MKIPIGSPSFTRFTWSNDAWLATERFPPLQKKAMHEAILDEILQERVRSSRNRIKWVSLSLNNPQRIVLRILTA